MLINQFIEKIQKDSFELYNEFLHSQISSILPLTVNNSVMFNQVSYKLTIDNLILKKCEEIGLKLERYNLTKEHYNNIDRLLGYLYDELHRLVNGNIEVYLISVLTMLEYNRFLGVRLTTYFSNQEIESLNDKFLTTIVKSLEQMKIMFERAEQESEFYRLQYMVEELITLTHRSLEHLFEYLYFQSRISKSVEDSIDYQVSDDVILAIKLSLAITTLNIEKMSINCPKISISEKNHYEKLSDDLSSLNIVEIDVNDSAFNKIVRGELGFDLVSIKTILDRLVESNILLDEFFFSTESELITRLVSSLECSPDEAKTIIDFFTYQNVENPYQWNVRGQNRVLRKPLVKIGGNFFSFYSIVILSLSYFINDLQSNTGLPTALSKKLEPFYQGLNSSFEEVVFNLLKDKKNIKVFKDIDQDKMGSSLPGQIDILMIELDRIFVIEVKNFHMKPELKGQMNMISKLSKTGRNSIQGKLRSKIEWIEDNIDTVLDKLCLVKKDYKVDGFIVVRSFPGGNMDNLDYKIFTIGELREHFNI